MTTLILSAMQEELNAVLALATDVQQQQHHDLTVYQARINNQPVVLSLSHIGKVNAAVTAALLMAEYQPCQIINTGSAAGLSNALQVGDVVIADKLAYHDVDVTAFDYVIGQVPRMPAFYEAKLIDVLDHTFSFTMHRGLLLSGDSFIASFAKTDDIRRHFPEALALDMESTAIAQTAYRLQVPFIIIRAISDFADDAAALPHEEYLAIASKHCADVVSALI